MTTDSSTFDDSPDLKSNEDKLTELFKKHNFSLKKITKEYAAEAEKKIIVDVLHKTGWNRRKSAQLLGVSYKTIINRMKEFGLKP